ncbi:MAG TPA: prepilin-type N-terminal cleavage/methylation domain-containing protein [Actinoplanes sp.]|jgi:type IV pilus assembly protein PilA
MHEVINRLRTKKNDEGFTLIELLVVVVIIGVLVAIAVPVYLNYRKGAADKSSQSDVRGAVSAVEQFYADNGNQLPDTVSNTTDPKTGLVFKIGSGTSTQTATMSDKTTMGYYNKGDGSYLLCGTNTGGSGKWYVYNSTNGGSVAASPTAITAIGTCS